MSPTSRCRNKFAFIRSSIVLQVQSCHLYSRRCVTYNIHGRPNGLTRCKTRRNAVSRTHYAKYLPTTAKRENGRRCRQKSLRACCATGDCYERHAVVMPRMRRSFTVCYDSIFRSRKSRRHLPRSCQPPSR